MKIYRLNEDRLSHIIKSIITEELNGYEYNIQREQERQQRFQKAIQILQRMGLQPNPNSDGTVIYVKGDDTDLVWKAVDTLERMLKKSWINASPNMAGNYVISGI